MSNRDTFDRFTPPDRGRFGDNETQSVRGNDSVRSNIIDIDVVIHHGTDKAVLVSIDGSEVRAQWLPRSRIEIDPKSATVTGILKSGRKVALGTATITLPTPLAKEKGLI